MNLMTSRGQSAPSVRTRRNNRTRTIRIVGRVLLYLFATALAALFMGPFFWTLGSSLKSGIEIRAYPPLFWPTVPLFSNYVETFKLVPFAMFYQNTLQVTILGVLGQFISATLVAYGFSRFRFPGRDVLFMLLISTLMLPREVILIPNFILFKSLGLLGTLAPLWLPAFFGGAFYVFLLRQFFVTLPRDIDEAARIDGANSLTILLRVLLPLSLPAMVSSAIFAFLYYWNDFLEPLIYLNKEQNFTLALGLRYLQTLPNADQEPRDQFLMAASLIVAAPCVVVFFVAQRYFVRGIVMSGIKG
jgi:multiple sugar transport system permease protein